MSRTVFALLIIVTARSAHADDGISLVEPGAQVIEGRTKRLDTRCFIRNVSMPRSSGGITIGQCARDSCRNSAAWKATTNVALIAPLGPAYNYYYRGQKAEPRRVTTQRELREGRGNVAG